MSNYEEKELKALDKIADTMINLENTCDKLNDSEGKVRHFLEQEKAFHEVKKIIRACKKIDHLEEKEMDHNILDIETLEELENNNLKDIAKIVNKLDATLDEITKVQYSKIKSFIEQKKALHEVKKILHKIGLLETYTDEELKDIENLF